MPGCTGKWVRQKGNKKKRIAVILNATEGFGQMGSGVISGKNYAYRRSELYFWLGLWRREAFKTTPTPTFQNLGTPTPASGDLANPTTKRFRFRQQLQLSYKIVEKLATNNPVDENFRLMIFVRLLLRLQPDSSSDSTALYLISNKWSMYI